VQECKKLHKVCVQLLVMLHHPPLFKGWSSDGFRQTLSRLANRQILDIHRLSRPCTLHHSWCDAKNACVGRYSTFKNFREICMGGDTSEVLIGEKKAIQATRTKGSQSGLSSTLAAYQQRPATGPPFHPRMEERGRYLSRGWFPFLSFHQLRRCSVNFYNDLLLRNGQ
jgi:hypothetical protein